MKNIGDSNQTVSFIDLRDSVVDYLDYAPPIEQASEVKALLETIANIDNEVSDDEKFILQEIYGVFDDYLNGEEDLPRYEVLIAPQNQDQQDMIEHLVTRFTKLTDKGGVCYKVGEYYSLDYAQMICKKYRSMNIFTAIEQQSV